MTRPTTLLQLQQLEQQSAAAQHRLDEINAQLANDSAIQAAQVALQQAQHALPPLQKRAREVEHGIDTASAKAKETEDQLYSGSVKNTKAMREMQQEIASLKEKQSTLEDEAFELMEAIENAEAAIGQHKQDLAAAQQAQHHQHQALILERDREQQKLGDLLAQQQTLIAQIDVESLKLYRALKPRTRGVPVVQMSADGTCGACGVQQDRATETRVRRGEVVQCPNCRRILIFA